MNGENLSFEDVQQLVSLIGNSPGAAIKASLGCTQEIREGMSWVSFSACTSLRDRDTLVPLEVVVCRDLPLERLTTALVLAKCVQCVRELYLHEFHEALLLGGERILDPHKVAA